MCGLDPRHSALDGTEIRACWVAAEPHLAGGEAIPSEPAPALDGARDGRPPARTFVPVDELDDVARRAPAATAGRAAPDTTGGTETAPPTSAVASSTGAASAPAGWSLWGDPEG